jgi:two-component system, chemotaxis family, sensor kinase Cph1
VNAVGHLSTLLDDLLFSAISGSTVLRQPVQLEHAAAQAMHNLSGASGATGATVTIGQLPTIQGNESDLVRLFQNLIGNAVKYRSEAPAEVHITAERVGPDWVIRIRDKGIGIAKENHHRVFGLFTRLHSDDIPGTGIGLDICKKIVEGLGGTIWVESELGVGSSFYFTVAADPASPRS